MATKAGADAAYWVPLLAAYTGARPSELCQLWTDDLSEEAGGLVVEFRNDANRGRLLGSSATGVFDGTSVIVGSQDNMQRGPRRLRRPTVTLPTRGMARHCSR